MYLNKYDSVRDLLMGLTQYFLFYNQERYHQSLGYKTPHEVYQTAIGGGAKIIDKFNGTEEVPKAVHTYWDSAIQLEHGRVSSLN
ncbi:hypothetical protein JCM14076_32840 [Methylosoma difficile]